MTVRGKSLWLLIDGYNLVSPGTSRPPVDGRSATRRHGSGGDQWLRDQRMKLLRWLDAMPQAVRDRTCVVFDAKNPPAGVSDRGVHRGIRVRFAVGYDEADDLIEEMIRNHHSAAQLMVVSSDHRLQTAASRRGAESMDADEWLIALEDDDLKLAVSRHKYATVDEPRLPPGESLSLSEAEIDAMTRPVDPPVDPAVEATDDPDDVDYWKKQFGIE